MDSMNICIGDVPILTMVLRLQMSAHTMSTCAHHGPRPFLILQFHRDLPLHQRTCRRQLTAIRPSQSDQQDYFGLLASGKKSPSTPYRLAGTSTFQH